MASEHSARVSLYFLLRFAYKNIAFTAMPATPPSRSAGGRAVTTHSRRALGEILLFYKMLLWCSAQPSTTRRISMAKVIMFRADFEALSTGRKLSSIQLFNNPSECPPYTKNTPSAFYVEVELVPTRRDVKEALFERA